jgi:hypothetical protein
LARPTTRDSAATFLNDHTNHDTNYGDTININEPHQLRHHPHQLQQQQRPTTTTNNNDQQQRPTTTTNNIIDIDEPTTHQWRLGTNNGSCGTVCSGIDGGCQNSNMKAINTEAQFEYALVASHTGTGAPPTCNTGTSNNNAGSSIQGEAPFLTGTDVCVYTSNSNGGGCGGSAASGSRRLCCCGTKNSCPVPCTANTQCDGLSNSTYYVYIHSAGRALLVLAGFLCLAYCCLAIRAAAAAAADAAVGGWGLCIDVAVAIGMVNMFSGHRSTARQTISSNIINNNINKSSLLTNHSPTLSLSLSSSPPGL